MPTLYAIFFQRMEHAIQHVVSIKLFHVRVARITKACNQSGREFPVPPTASGDRPAPVICYKLKKGKFMKEFFPRIGAALALALLPCLCCPPVLASGMIIDDLLNGTSTRWAEKRFCGATRYVFATQDGRPCIQATSRASASGLYYKISFDPVRYPILSWTWKIKHALPGQNEGLARGDDFAARVFVVFPSVMFWRTRSLAYVWAATLPRETRLVSPYNKNTMMIVVESGPEKAGTWTEEQRDIAADYKACFGVAPPKAGAIAIMTDTDQTGAEAVAWYGPISIQARPKDAPAATSGAARH